MAPMSSAHPNRELDHDEAERTCNVQATDDRNWLAIQTLELHAQTIRYEEAGFAMHVFSPLPGPGADNRPECPGPFPSPNRVPVSVPEALLQSGHDLSSWKAQSMICLEGRDCGRDVIAFYCRLYWSASGLKDTG
jgi:hypothetical protein